MSVVLLSGCTVDVGPCDPFAAREIVYLSSGIEGDPFNGTPMFAGQALMQVSCGNGSFCHSNAATGDERYGVPTGMDFDFSVPCDASGCLPGAVQRLRANQAVGFDYRHHILQELQRGTMPPGRLGAEIRAEGGQYVFIDTSDIFFVGGVDDGVALPEVGTREGREILSNWLSCGLPMVERFEEPNTPQDSGRNCRGSTDCVYRVDSLAQLPEANWPSLYERMIGPFCASSCHGPGAADFREESQLDLSNIVLAYDQLVGRVAQGEECMDGGRTIVIPGDAENSLLIDKLEHLTPSCGDPMPSGSRLFPEDFMEPLRAWIDAGAVEGLPNGASCSNPEECESGFCWEGLPGSTSDSICCNTACTGTCTGCSIAIATAPDGTCSPIRAQNDPFEDCAPYTCDGTATGCMTECSVLNDCTPGFMCMNNVCVPRPMP